MRPRLGHIQFLNCLPLYYGLVKQDVLLDVELVKGAPRDLAERLLAGELDIAPIPSIEYCRHHEKLLLIPDISVSSDGEVKSILVLAKEPAEALDGKTVALTDTSRTSQALTKIVLEDLFRVRPRYVEMPADLAHMMREADAALLIGDDALRALYTPSPLIRYDLGEKWKELAGQPMVYAVWAARREFVAKRPDAVKQVAWGLAESVRYSAAHVDAIAQYAARWEIFPVSFLKSYFESLRFDFDDRFQAGLRTFFESARRHEFVKEVARLEFVR